jgi:hypothetical protein
MSTLSGRILANDGKPGAAVTVMAIPESSIQSGDGKTGAISAKTDSEGRFQIFVPQGRYALAAEFSPDLTVYYPGGSVPQYGRIFIFTAYSATGAPEIVMQAPTAYRLSSAELKALCDRCPYPELTESLKGARISDTLVLHITVNPEGMVGNIHAVRGHQLLRSWGVEGVRKWRYRPLVVLGKATEFSGLVSLSFPG